MVYGYGVEVASTFEKFYTHVQYSHSLYQVVLECLLVPSCMQRAVYGIILELSMDQLA